MSEGVVTQDSSLSSNLMSEHLDDNSLHAAGQILKQARIGAGLHIAALAVTLKVPVKRLEALEDGNQALLPDMVYVRALASSVCRTLKVDPALVLEKLPKADLPRLNNDDGSINMPLRSQNSSVKVSLLDVLKAPWLIGVFLLIAGAALIYLWPKSQTLSFFDLGSVLKNTPITKQNANVDSGVKSLQEHISARPVSVTSETTTGLATSPVKELIANVSASLPPERSGVDPASTFPLVAVNTTIPPNSVVVFRASGQTWVEVKSVNGITILKKLLNDGESAGASGTLPLTVIVGRADVTQVEVRGKPIDLAAIAKSNVARFEVN